MLDTNKQPELTIPAPSVPGEVSAADALLAAFGVRQEAECVASDSVGNMTIERAFVLDCLEKGEDGDAALLRWAAPDYLYDSVLDEWFYYDSIIWVPDYNRTRFQIFEKIIQIYQNLIWSGELAQEYVEKAYKHINKLRTLRYKKTILELAATGNEGLIVDNSKWDSDLNLIACLTSVFNNRDGSDGPGRPDQYLRRRTNVDPAPAGTSPRKFVEFLQTTFKHLEPAPEKPELEPLYETVDASERNFTFGREDEGRALGEHNTHIQARNMALLAKYDEDLAQYEQKKARNTELMIAFLKRLLGYAMLGSCKEHIMVIFYGPEGRNGKTTLVKLLGYIFGDYAGDVQPEILLSNMHGKSAGSASPELVDLQGMRFVFASEPNNGEFFDPGVVKRLTGGDVIACRALYQNKTTRFVPRYTIFLLTNHKPIPPGLDDPAFWRRIILIPFNVTFVDEPEPGNPRQAKINKNLLDELKAEAPAILRWIIDGALEYQEKGLCIPDFLKQEVEQYRTETDVMGQFLDECCMQANGHKVRAGELYRLYSAWCTDIGHKPMSGATFGRSLVARGYTRGKDGKGNFYNDVTLAERGLELAGLKL